MNTSQPVSSHIQGVHFTFLPSSEIRALSAKRISTPTTFDTLLNPVPGGLYSTELGQFGDNACSTCGLKTPQCPGHCGHIELPVPCYHPTFFDQVLKLLRGTCIYCNRLKLKQSEIAKYICKLRLVRRGLLQEANSLDDILPKNAEQIGPALLADVGAKASASAQEIDVDSEEEEDTDESVKLQIIWWEKVTKRAISNARRNGTVNLEKTEAMTKARQEVIAGFMRAMTKSRTCGKCGAVNPSYRKDRFVKIFQKALSEKERTKNIQGGHKAKNFLAEQSKKRTAEQKVQAGMKRKRDEDEGVADMDTPPEVDDNEGEESGEEESESESGSESEIAGAVDDAAGEGPKTKKTPRSELYVNPSHVLAELESMFAQEQEIFSLVYGGIESSPQSSNHKRSNKYVSADMFFVRDILVPPNRYRPEARTGNDEIAEAQENSLYKAILNQIESMTRIQRQLSGKDQPQPETRARTMADLENNWTQLQDAVNSLVDRERNPLQGAAGRRNADGIKQKLEKKEGMFRKYMMGKRVNFAARTVISPDPNIETNEIGVPPVFAIKLTYPEPVTNWNVEDLQQAVRNGALQWPGAVAIENENGQVINLERKTPDERLALANQLQSPPNFMYGPGARGTRPKKVHRHLNNGDIVIMNRQPTLHKPSMMCHRARVLPGEKTLRMHYANCNTYNADFDGDEMNLHFPQNDIARAEALSIADTDHQYLSGTAGNPLRGLIQDHISMGVWLTNRDTFFDRGQYMQLLYAALRPENGHCTSGRIETVEPAIYKPKKLWTGKQVVSSILKNVTPETHQGLTMTGKSTTEAAMWGLSIPKKFKEDSLSPAQRSLLSKIDLESLLPVQRQILADGSEESAVLIQDGYLCQGVLDKKQIGPSSGGFVNGVYEAYGHTVAGRLLSVLGRLLTRMLQIRAFSCGVEDLIFTKDGEQQRKNALSGAETVGLETAAKFVSLLPGKPEASNGEDSQQQLRSQLENVAKDDRELKRRLEDVLRDDSKQKFLDQLTQSATSKLSTAVTTACLPTALVKPFPKNQMQAMTSSGAKGSKVNANQISCNLGQQNLEGRRVPVMVSGKTLPCFAPFETSVRAGGYIVDRFLTGVRPQEYFFHAMSGREGLIDTAVKTSRSGYLQRCLIKGMEGLRVEYDTTVRDTADGSMIQFLYGEDGLDVAKAKYLADFKFAAENHLSLFHSFSMREHFDHIMSEKAAEYNKNAEKAYRRANDLAASDPVLALYPPAKYAGSTSEKAYRDAREYITKNPDRLIRDKKNNIVGVGVTKKNFQAILDLRYLRSVVESGEAVGVVAGQSIGEPSTQMTLNTFHLAGASAKNVTQGIPRLREILMTAAGTTSMATPSMILKLNEEITVDDAKKFAKGISKLRLAELIDKVTVTEKQGSGVMHGEVRKYEVRLDLFPRKEYETEYAITVEEVISAIEHRFLPGLQTITRKEIKRRGDEKGLKAQIGESSGTVEQQRDRPEIEREGGNDDSDGEGDDDATRDKAKNNKQQAGYEAMEDEEENDLARNNQPVEDVPDVLPGEPEDEAYGGSEKATSDTEDDKPKKSAAKDRENRIRGNQKTNDIVRFQFNDAKGDLCIFTMEYESSISKILMLNLVEAAARTALIQHVHGLDGASFVEESAEAVAKAKKAAEDDAKDTEDLGVHLEIATAGVNIPAMWSYPHILKPHLIYTNSIHEMLKHYGVEAARSTIVLELQSTFAGHGVSVDARHLTLIADYMTRNGGYQAFSRFGYNAHTSPFMKMSFETTVAFMKDAVLEGDWEALKNPSARICVGGLSKVGTGGFDVFLPVDRGEKDEDKDVDMDDA